VEIQLASSKNEPLVPEALLEVHNGLTDMQSSIQIHQGAAEHLTEEVSIVRQLVIRSRNSAKITICTHADVDRLEGEIKAVISRLNDIYTQVVER
jgi:hypothetical protein